MDIKEDLETTQFSEIEDEFAKINLLTLDLLSIITKRKQQLQDLYKAPGDYEKLMEQIRNDDDETLMYWDDNQENAEDDNDSGDSGNNSDTTSTVTPTSTSGSSPGSSTPTNQSIQSPTDDEWCLPTPNNSPQESGIQRQLNPRDLRNALNRAIADLSKFNQEHPYPPPGRPLRHNVYTGSYNYNRQRRQTGTDRSREEKKK